MTTETKRASPAKPMTRSGKRILTPPGQEKPKKRNARGPRKSNGKLPKLTDLEERFVTAIANGSNYTDAYVSVFGVGNYTRNSLNVVASRKAADPKIQAHMAAIRSVAVLKTQLSLDERIADELAFAQRAENAGNFSAAGMARDRVNKLLGHYEERVRLTGNMSDSELIAALTPAVGQETAAAIAQAMGAKLGNDPAPESVH